MLLSLLGDLLICLAYYGFMLIFMVIAIVFAKTRFAWVCFAIGAVPQLVSGLFLLKGNLTGNIGYNVLYWAVYFCIVIITAFLIVRRKKKRAKD